MESMQIQLRTQGALAARLGVEVEELREEVSSGVGCWG